MTSLPNEEIVDSVASGPDGILAGLSEGKVWADLSTISPRASRDLAKRVREHGRGAQMLITMGCGDQCPVVPGLRRDDWPLEDPKGKPIARVREIRDDVRARVVALLAREGWACP